MNKKLLIGIVVCFMLLNYVNALGLSPSKIELFFESNTRKESYFRIINNENKDVQVSLYVRGDLAKYIELENNLITIAENEPEAIVKYIVNIPRDLSPGTHSAEILAVENGNTVGNILLANIGIIHQIKVRVPYPDQYIEGMLYISEARPNEKTTFTVTLYNVGTKDIENVKGSIIISNSNNQPITSIKTNEISLEAGKKSKIEGEWTVNILPGTYNAQAIVEYDNNKVLNMEKDFDIGEPLIEIDSLTANSFKLGTIAKFDIILSNKWNQDMQNVFAITEISDDKGVLIDKYQTNSETIPSLGTSKLSAYWDTDDIDPGDFIMSVKAHYLGRIREKIYELKVKQNEIIIQAPSITGEVVGSENEFKVNTTLLIIIVVGLFVIVILQMVLKYLAKSKPPKKEEKTEKLETGHQDLRKYIKSKLSQGYTRDSIRKTLLEKGWERETIDYEMMKAEENIE